MFSKCQIKDEIIHLLTENILLIEQQIFEITNITKQHNIK
jgi:hypothetical protein